MTTTPEIFKSSIFGMSRKIGVTGTGNGSLFFVIATAGILVFKQDGNGSTGGMTIEETAFENRDIIFFTRRGSFLHASLATFDIFHEIGY